MLSGGMKRRALIAQALVHRPPVIVLDEPTAGVDVELRQKLWFFIKELNAEGHTIVLTTHYLQEAEALCNRVAMLRAGKVVALDTTTNLLKKFAAKNLKLKLSLKNLFKLSNIIKGINFSADGDFYTFELKKIDDIGKIISALNKASIEILDMETVDQDLENIFLKLTGNKI
jgi:ABC-2 type transport system ATP-binding protein